MGTSKPVRICVVLCVAFITLQLAQCDGNNKLTLSNKLRTFYKTFMDDLIEQEVLLSQMENKQSASLNNHLSPNKESSISHRVENEGKLFQMARTSLRKNKKVETLHPEYNISRRVENEGLIPEMANTTFHMNENVDTFNQESNKSRTGENEGQLENTTLHMNENVDTFNQAYNVSYRVENEQQILDIVNTTSQMIETVDTLNQECNVSRRVGNEGHIVQKTKTSSQMTINIDMFTKVILKALKGEKKSRHALQSKLDTLNVSIFTAVGQMNTTWKTDIDAIEVKMQASDTNLKNHIMKPIEALEINVNTLINQTNMLGTSFETVVEQMNETWISDIEMLEEKMKSNDNDLKTKLETSIDLLDNNLKLKIRQTANMNLACTARVDELERNMETMHQLLESLIKENENLKLSGVNFALGKSASQSSIFDANIGANVAVDGNFDGKWSGKSCMHTGVEMNPWWRVDLAKNRIIGRVIIKNRADCCGERLRDLTVSIADTVKGEYKMFAKYIGPSHNGEVITLTNKQKVNGRFLKLQIIRRSKAEFALCEVQAFYF